MIHEGLVGIEKSQVHEVNMSAKEAERVNTYWLNYFAENCRIRGGYKSLKRKFKECPDDRTIYLDAQQAVKFGLIDFIGTPRIEAITKITYCINQVTRNNSRPS